MKVLVIGSGGREHALLWKLAHSPSVKEVYVIPGNDGMTDVAHLIPVKGTEDILDFARLMEVDLTVAGPETVLTEGLEISPCHQGRRTGVGEGRRHCRNRRAGCSGCPRDAGRKNLWQRGRIRGD